MQQNVLVWKPHKGPQTIFHQNPSYEVMFGGTKGPGKTDSILREGLRQIHKPNYRAIIFRRTYPRLGEIIDRSFKYFKGMGATYSDKDIQLKLPAWSFPSGAKYCFGHCQREQDKYNYQGKEFHYLGFDQVEEFTESQYLFLLAQNRTSDRTIKCYVRSSANPGGVGHAWVKRRFIEPLKPHELKYFKRVNDEDIECTKEDPHGISRSFVPASVYDNPSIIQNDPNYVRRLEQLNETDKQALLYGNWEVFKGQFFNMWRTGLHVQEKHIRYELKKFISLDYGFGAPSAVYWWQVGYDGSLHAYRELYREKLTYEELAKLLMSMTPDDEAIDYLVADPAIFGDKSHHNQPESGESGAETMQRVFKGWTTVLRADNSRVIGWGRMRIMFKPMDQQEPMLTFSSRCKEAIRTIPTLIHDEVNVEDLNSEGEDHAADSVRYGLMSRPSKSVKEEKGPERRSIRWWEQRLAERAA